MDIVLIELFSGINGFAKGLIDAGFNITHHYFSEIDEHAIANTKYNFPHAEYIGSVVDISGFDIRKKHPHSHIVTIFGFPCQDLSIAGKRLGFKGKRSSLFYHAARIVRESQSENYIWENVAGLMSSNKGKDILAVFEEMYLSGYLFDVDELNTSWVLPQNRVRLYSVGYNIKYVQKCLIEVNGVNTNYNICVKIIEGVLLTKYPQYLTEAQSLSEQKQNDLVLGYLKTKEQDLYNGQRMSYKYLEIIKTLQLNELRSLYQSIQLLLLKQNVANSNILINQSQIERLTDIMSDMVKMNLVKANLSLYIGTLLLKLSEENYCLLSKYIILILSNKTTQNQTFSYAEMQRNIEISIIRLTLLYPNCWNEALSNLIEKKKNINYAQKNRGNKGSDAQKDNSDAIQLPITNESENDTSGNIATGGGQELFPITENDFGATKGAIDTTSVRTITGGGQQRRDAQLNDVDKIVTVSIRDGINDKDQIASTIQANYFKGYDTYGRDYIKTKNGNSNSKNS